MIYPHLPLYVAIAVLTSQIVRYAEKQDVATRILEATEFLPENFWLTLKSRDLNRRLNETAFYEKVSKGLDLECL